jgi:photosystem II stability/assembly factor-like uncharacterized protein
MFTYERGCDISHKGQSYAVTGRAHPAQAADSLSIPTHTTATDGTCCSVRMPMRNLYHCGCCGVSRLLLLVVCSLLGPISITYAQEHLDTAGRWKTLNDSALSGFPTDAEETAEAAVRPLFFSDSLHGVLGTKNGTVFLTDDGGRSWRGTRISTPIPHTRFSDGSGLSPLAHHRAVGDTLWRRLRVASDTATGAASFDGLSIAALYSQQKVIRLAISSDRGNTWRTLDTTTLGSGGSPMLSSLTRFGPLPAPAGRTIVDHTWGEIYGLWDGRTLAVRSVARYDSAGGIYTRHYLGRLDPTTMTARWSQIPDNLGTVRFISSNDAYAFTTSSEPPPSQRIHIGIWWSRDGGVRWDSIAELPEWIDFPELLNLKFLSPTHGVSSNGVTNDGGRTWRRWSHPFAGAKFYGPRLSVVDSTHYFLYSVYSHFARSTDAGRTWSRTLGGSHPHAVAANRGRVVVGRDFQTLLFSPDSGESWQDLAELGRTPAEMRTVWALAWPDSVREPERVTGVASFMPYDTRHRVSFIESSDGGRSWREGLRVPQFDSAISIAESVKEFGSEEILGAFYAGQPPVVLRFIEKANRGGTVGFACSVSALFRTDDAGRTWRLLCDTIRFGDIAMADEMHGIAYGLPSHAKPAALYMTSDGGVSWKWTKTLSVPNHYGLGLTAFDTSNYRLLAPDMNSDHEAWNIIWSEDGGRTWKDRQYQGQDASWTMDTYWLDSTDLHIIDGFGDVRHSTNAGNRWHLLHPTIATFVRTRENAILSEANITGSDGSYIYFASAENLLGRWRVARRRSLPTGVRNDLAVQTAGAGNATLTPNLSTPTRSTLRFELARGSTVGITICDLLGQPRMRLPERELEAGAQAIVLDLSELVPGSYFVRLVHTGTQTSIPLVIAR